ncbi:Protein of unknown function [Bacillus toyonensis]|nr:Protein of unknown function [Bacillus toyonensis]
MILEKANMAKIKILLNIRN